GWLHSVHPASCAVGCAGARLGCGTGRGWVAPGWLCGWPAAHDVADTGTIHAVAPGGLGTTAWGGRGGLVGGRGGGRVASGGVGERGRRSEAVADSSFDVVSKVERQEVDNALNQAAKELSQRFDFRGTNASIAWSGEHAVTIQADTEDRVRAALEVFREKLGKRGASLKALDAGEPD